MRTTHEAHALAEVELAQFVFGPTLVARVGCRFTDFDQVGHEAQEHHGVAHAMSPAEICLIKPIGLSFLCETDAQDPPT